ncbi:MAG: YggS family pyridoxal phosphate-dependent enzyme [Chitinophagales bacterium]|nr:YggS family pyridoxal phosphate-dependent enzyme [Chitinophagales bacterium]
MAINVDVYQQIKKSFGGKQVQLVAVSKTKPIEDIQGYYDMGQRDFGENYVQEFVEKVPALPADIRWHFIGHLQRNKVKLVIPHVYLIHGVDSERLLSEIQKEAAKANLRVNVLLQLFVAQEETKFGFDLSEFEGIIADLSRWPNVNVLGVMGMSSVTENTEQIRSEFKALKQASDRLVALNPAANILSMGMSGDYLLAIEEGSNMVRIGSTLFGAR